MQETALMRQIIGILLTWGTVLSMSGQVADIKKTYQTYDSISTVSLLHKAEFYSLAENYEKAAFYGELAVQANLELYGNRSIEYMESAMKLSLIYAKMNDFPHVIQFMRPAITISKMLLQKEYEDLNYFQRYLSWQNLHTIFDDIYPNYVAHCQTDSAVSDLYDTFIFSKGITTNRKKALKDVTWKDIQNNLSEKDIAIEFISPSNIEADTIFFYALTIRKDSKYPQMTYLFNIWQLQDSIKHSCNDNEKNLKVGQLIWDSLLTELKGIENIYFSPTHILHSIAIENLPINKHESYSDRYNIYRLTSTREIATNRIRNSYATAALFGGLEYEDSISTSSIKTKHRSGFEKLYHTELEVDSITKILTSKNVVCFTYKGHSGTEEVFKSLSGKSIDILHVASHGKYISSDDVPTKREYNNYNFLATKEPKLPIYNDKALSRSFIVLSNGNRLTKWYSLQNTEDGIITALEIATMDLTGCSIAVLSTCDSALGEFGFDDSIIGLQSALKYAGVNTILMNLDKVDDEATQILMVEFYRNLMNGKTKYQSLKEAQQYLRRIENGKYDDPKYWATFIMLDGLN